MTTHNETRGNSRTYCKIDAVHSNSLKKMADSSRRDVDNKTLELVKACLAHRVRFHGTPGVLMIELEGLSLVLEELANDYGVLGFDSFTVHDREVHPRLDYLTDFGEGISVTG
ncbi:MAG: hypothetical protein ACRD1R_08140 [Acidobacteriota bacterium]